MTTIINDKYTNWINHPGLDQALVDELESIKNNPAEIEERFYKELEFGTGGLRGIIGAGTNRINKYTVRKATYGLAQYILGLGNNGPDQGVVIAYDSRHMSAEFAHEVAGILTSKGIKTYIFPELAPTPELSFAVRELQAVAGIVITASHNPPEYNGFKVYEEDGGQIPPHMAKQMTDFISNVDNELELEVLNQEEAVERGLFIYVGDEVRDQYISKVTSLSLNKNMIEKITNDFRIVYTPLHGTGNKPVRKALAGLGFHHVDVVKEQELPDPNFSTVKYPNPEEKEVFTLAMEKAKRVDADIIMGTDPDADRLGVVVKDQQGEYQVLTGNQLGALLLHYILSQKKQDQTLPSNAVVIKTIVTSEFGSKIAEHFGVETIDTLTGFKYIGEKIKEFNITKEKEFVFGYEESYGYLIGNFVRDKDAVQACALAAEVAAYYKSQGLTLYEGLLQLFEKFGYYQEDLLSLTLQGKAGQEQIKHMMNHLRLSSITEIAEVKVTKSMDYLTSIETNLTNGLKNKIHLPSSNVLKYELEDNSWIAVRPSGTEPKIKIYLGVVSDSLHESAEKLLHLKKEIPHLLGLKGS